MKRAGVKRAGDVLTQLFNERFHTSFDEAKEAGPSIFSSWSNIITEVWQNEEDSSNLAFHSKISDLSRGNLLIEGDHPGWVQLLQTKKREILGAVKKKYPELNIKSVNFKLSR